MQDMPSDDMMSWQNASSTEPFNTDFEDQYFTSTYVLGVLLSGL